MSGVVCLNLARREAVLGDGRVVPVTNMLDATGDEAASPADAVAVVCGEGMEWYAERLSDFDAARVM